MLFIGLGCNVAPIVQTKNFLIYDRALFTLQLNGAAPILRHEVFRFSRTVKFIHNLCPSALRSLPYFRHTVAFPTK
jgi:hypothetical protein